MYAKLNYNTGVAYENAVLPVFSKLIEEELCVYSPDISSKIQRRGRIQGKACKYEIDLSFKTNTGLWLAECKFHHIDPSQATEVREFFSKCHDIQQANFNIEVRGLFFSSTFFENSAIDYVSTYPISDIYNHKVRLYTVKPPTRKAYAILLRNATSQSSKSIPIILLDNSTLFQEGSFEEMVYRSLTYLHSQHYVFNKGVTAHDISAVESLTNALLHKNYIEECIAFSSPIYANRYNLISGARNSTELAGILEIIASYVSAKIKRYRLLYKKYPNPRALQNELDLIKEFANRKYIPNGIATLARVCMPSLAIEAATSNVRSLFNVATRSVSSSCRVDSCYLSYVNDLSLARAKIAMSELDSVENVLLDFHDSISTFPTSRHIVAARQSYLAACIEFGKAVGDKKAVIEYQKSLINHQIRESLGRPG